ncbi:hypothetical protein, partial [Bacteroides uniformis]|uniref:hypothetical protein n=1 Tax=Bacteroides uniformis TaxID=820 RepID=UPI00195DE76D
ITTHCFKLFLYKSVAEIRFSCFSGVQTTRYLFAKVRKNMRTVHSEWIDLFVRNENNILALHYIY